MKLERQKCGQPEAFVCRYMYTSLRGDVPTINIQDGVSSGKKLFFSFNSAVGVPVSGRANVQFSKCTKYAPYRRGAVEKTSMKKKIYIS